MEYSFFNLTNPTDVLRGGSKPRVSEIGPFVYVEKQYRSDFTWNDDEDTLTYREHKFYVFDKDRTVEAQFRRVGHTKHWDPKKTKITTINAVSLGALAKLGPAYWKLLETFVVFTTEFDKLFSVRTVHEYVNGYTVKSIDALKFPGINPNETVREHDPDYKHPTTVRVGKKDQSKILELVKFREATTLTTECPWGSNPLPGGKYCPNVYPCCASTLHPHKRVSVWDGKTNFTANRRNWQLDPNQVRGTNGEQFRMHLKKNEFVVVFFDLVMRALKMENVNGEESVHHGIDLLTFRPARSFWASARENEFNNRFYQWGPSGLVNLTTVQQGVPLFSSLPHFLGCDPLLASKIDGLKPNDTLHASWIGVEPMTGITMIERNRAMVSTRMPTRIGNTFAHLTDSNVFVPFVWFEASSEITHEGVKDFKQIIDAKTLRTRAIWFCSVSLAVGLSAAAYLERRRRQTQRTMEDYEPLI